MVRVLSRGAACALSLGAVLAACADTDDHQVLAPTVVGMTESTPAFYTDDQVTLFQVQTPVRLPMRRPTDPERQALGRAPPFPREPFIRADDVEITIRFTLVNLDDVQRTVELLIDPWNEFVRYRPMINAVDQEATLPDFSGFDKYFVLGPKERFEGVITPDDTRELAVDLATAFVLIRTAPEVPEEGEENTVNGLVNRAFNLQNRSSTFDPLLNDVISKLPAVPGVTGFDLGLRTTEAVNVAVEVIVDVRDLNGERVVPPGEPDRTFGPPGDILSPPAP